MDFILLFLERHSGILLVLITCLAAIFLLVRPLMRMVVDQRHGRKLEKIAKEMAGRPPKPLDGEMEGLLQKASSMGMTDQERLRRLAQSNPERAKDLVRAWIYGDGHR